MILVTGGAGYIGSHCVLSLLKNGFDVVVFDSLELGHIEIINRLKNLEFKGKFADFIQGDLKNKKDIVNVFKKHKIEAVIHFAAYSLVEESVKNPEKYYKNNVAGSENLLAAMQENNVNNIVFSSTAAVYGEPKSTPIKEDQVANPINPYGETKLAIEKTMDEYDKKYGIKSVRLRYFNVIGANKDQITGEWHKNETHLIPNILKSTFTHSRTFKIFGEDYDTPDGTCIRDYINIEDLIDAHILALKYLFSGGKTDYFNIGTSQGSSVKEVFAAAERTTNTSIPVEITTRRPGDPAVLVADSTKAKKILGWTNKKTLEYSIKTAYKWEKELQKLIKQT